LDVIRPSSIASSKIRWSVERQVLTLEAAYTAFSFFSQESTSVRRMPASALSSKSGSRCSSMWRL
jgi:hypothetical protein